MSSATATDRVVRTFVELAALPSPSQAEGPAADYVRGFLDGLGIDWVEDGAASAIPAGCGNITARLDATVEGTPIFLCSHLDTVPLADDVVPVITDDGHVTNERDAILGGDNKAAVAVMLELLREIVEQDIAHAGIEVIFTPCEEIGLVGAKHYDTSQLRARYGYVFDHANDIGKVVGKAPTQVSLEVAFTGVPSHSGIAPEEGRSAIVAAADAIGRLQLGRIDEQTTANIGVIRGGSAVNIVAEHCVLRGEVRSLDHARVTEVAQQMVAAITDAAVAHGVDVDIDSCEEYRAYAFTDRSPVVRTAFRALEAAGFVPELVPCGGGADANIFNAAGIACLNMCNGMRRIHTADESIAVDDLTGMLRVSRELVAAARA